MRKYFSALFFGAAAAVTVALSGAAFAGETDAQQFVEAKHGRLMQILEQPATPARETAMQSELHGLLDTDELTRRIFGAPCPPDVKCQNLWTKLSPQQQAEMASLFRQLVEKTYKRNIERTKGFEVSYRGTREATTNEWKIRTEAKNKAKPRDPAVRIAYLVRQNGATMNVIDIETENSSMWRNYNLQISQILLADNATFDANYGKLRDRLKGRIAAQ
jgi:ABC-type transporter MlaC component